MGAQAIALFATEVAPAGRDAEAAKKPERRKGWNERAEAVLAAARAYMLLPWRRRQLCRAVSSCFSVVMSCLAACLMKISNSSAVASASAHALWRCMIVSLKYSI